MQIRKTRNIGSVGKTETDAMLIDDYSDRRKDLILARNSTASTFAKVALAR